MARKITRLRIAMCLGALSLVMGSILWIQYRSPARAKSAFGHHDQAAASSLENGASDYSQRLVACIYDDIPITRRDLGEFLIGRYGVENIDKMVGQHVIELAAANSGISVTPAEVDAEVAQTISDSHMSRQQFTELIVSRYAKNMFEWREDVIRNRLVLSKLCRDNVIVTDEELRKGFESTCGDKIRARVILWLKEEHEEALKQLPKIQSSDAEFDRCSRQQKDDKLADKGGEIELFHNFADNAATERAAFALKPGEVSSLIETKDGWMVIKCIEHLPATTGINFDEVREDMRREAINRKLYKSVIPQFLAGLRERSHPKILLKKDDINPDSFGNIKSTNEAVAMIYDDTPISREQFGEWLIGRYGADEIERLVNLRTVNYAAQHKGIELSKSEIEDEISKTLKSLKLTKEQLVKTVLKPRGLSLAAWKQDEIVRMKLTRLCSDRVKVTQEDIEHAYTASYGEKLQARIIMWPAKEERVAMALYPKLRDSEEEFDRAARTQADPNLSSRGGSVEPFGRYTTGNEEMEKAAFRLKPGEVSHLISTNDGFVVIKCIKLIPPQNEIKLDDVRQQLAQDCNDRKLRQIEIPNLCRELYGQAHPRIFLKKDAIGEVRQEPHRQIADK